MNYLLYGTGPVTVVFESNVGDLYNTWNAVFPTVADRTRSFAYNRAGIGGSDASTNPRDTVNIVGELRDTLSALGLPPPYVVVGHAMGGLYAQGFARLFPTEVVGWVSVEGRPDDYATTCTAQGVTDCDTEPNGLNTAAEAEWNARGDASEQVLTANSIKGSLPIRVLFGTGPRTEPTDALNILQQLLTRDSQQSVNGEFINATSSGSYIQTSQPDLVAQEIQSVLP